MSIFVPGQNLQHWSGTENCSDTSHFKTGHFCSSTLSHFTTPFRQMQLKHGSKFVVSPCSITISPLVLHGSTNHNIHLVITFQHKTILVFSNILRQVSQHSPDFRTGNLQSTSGHLTGEQST